MFLLFIPVFIQYPGGYNIKTPLVEIEWIHCAFIFVGQEGEDVNVSESQSVLFI